jgi:hypothetical protein
MFESNGSFISLDDFFRTDDKQSLLWKPEVEERIKELDAIFRPWTLRHWKFTNDINKDNILNDSPYTVVEIMRQASTSYIIAQFNASLLLSSVTVEKIIHFLMDLNGLHDEICITANEIRKYARYDVQTVEGKKYFGFWKNRFGEFLDKGNGTWSFYEIESLDPSIDAVKKIGYDISPIDQRIDGSHRLFVSRRDTLGHGNYEGLALVQQIADIQKGTYKDQDELIKKIGDLFDKHKTQALEQYQSASEFIMGVFRKFDEIYNYWS